MIQIVGIFLLFVGAIFFYFNNITLQGYGNSSGFINNLVLQHKLTILRKNGVDDRTINNLISTTISESRGEKICRETLQKIYGQPFIRIRPDFLKNPKTGRNLELDCYNEKLRIAVEYNGAKSHYNDERQIENDKYKKSVCKKMGITFITVPFTVPEKQIEIYLTYKLQRRGLLPKTENIKTNEDDDSNDSDTSMIPNISIDINTSKNSNDDIVGL